MFQMPEEDSFAVFVKIMQDYKMRDMFKPTMAELGLCMFQLENLVQVFIYSSYLYGHLPFSSEINSLILESSRNYYLIYTYIFNLKVFIQACTPAVGFSHSLLQRSLCLLLAGLFHVFQVVLDLFCISASNLCS